MKKLIDVLASYESYHTKGFTKISHFIGVPCITLSLFIILSWWHIPIAKYAISFAWITGVLLVSYYLILDIVFGLLSAIIFFLIILVAEFITQGQMSLFSFIIFALLFVFGWIVQLIGHRHEGNRPALVDNFLQVFTAPLYLIAEIVFKLGFRKELQAKMIQLASTNRIV